MQPKVYISYSPGKPGSLFALFYFESGVDIHGWHIEARNLYFSAAFFTVEHFYANHTPRLYRSIQDDVYGPWTIDYPPTRDEIRCPAPEAIAHELERMQSMFVEEWLDFRNDGGTRAEERADQPDESAPEASVKARRLPRMLRQGNAWTYMTPGIDMNLVQLLRKYWRLCEKVPAR